METMMMLSLPLLPSPFSLSQPYYRISPPPPHPRRRRTRTRRRTFTGGTVLCNSYRADNNGNHALLLKEKASEIVDDLKGTCIYLVGMMGSGKYRVGKSLAESLGYYFFDSDKLIEEAAGGGKSVSQLMEEDGESFRDAETEVLKQLSCMGRLVVATGGDTVLQPTNWSYLRYGVTVWLDVPVEALAQRATGLTSDSNSFLEERAMFSDHSQALESLSSMLNVRKQYYGNADTSISLMKLASEYGHDNLNDITAEMVALQVLNAINNLMKHRSK